MECICSFLDDVNDVWLIVPTGGQHEVHLFRPR